MASIPFKDWVFDSLVTYGAIKDYDKTPHVGKGRSPKGNLSIQIGRIGELRESKDPNDQVWGLIGYAGLQSDGEIGPRFKGTLDEFCKLHNPEDPDGVFRAFSKAAQVAAQEFKARFKEKCHGKLENGLPKKA